jgi:hypothetical protein
MVQKYPHYAAYGLDLVTVGENIILFGSTTSATDSLLKAVHLDH